MTAWDIAGQPRKPSVLCIGAQKAGTSWLAQVLNDHPQIWNPPYKEVQFFNYRFIPGHRYWIDWHFRNKPGEIRAGYVRRKQIIPPAMDAYLTATSTSKQRGTNHWYKKIFAPAPAQAKPMDISPEYSTLPEEGVEFVSKFLPNVKVIYLIRDPVDRAVSQLRMNLRREKRNPETLDDWLAEVENPVLEERGDYATYVPRWRRFFGPDQLLILPYGQIRSDPFALMERVEQHLGIGRARYDALWRRVFATPPGLEPPPQARAALAARLAPQYDFLRTEFGAAFADATR
ncbi:sulfotransferase [Paracoccus sp. (in: a-proteobacteria)]|uniref:sulfotransferase n=1 Tax=Paracoccus sp. TaxID=267 RepID=UPI0026E00536|nr:sulfotransferase [Paracoccus sp. (in: a-proteobacteria)]MDO5647079.1 sulfotransferase [Paracoccus sp. (in: a-proteobacteria)]